MRAFYARDAPVELQHPLAEPFDPIRRVVDLRFQERNSRQSLEKLSDNAHAALLCRPIRATGSRPRPASTASSFLLARSSRATIS